MSPALTHSLLSIDYESLTLGEKEDAMTSLPHAPVKVPARRVVLGQIVRVDEAYGRELPVPPIVLFPVLLAALLPELLGLLIGTLLGRGALGTARRPLKSLRKGPEYMVTPIRVRDADDSLVEIEVHGYLNRTALIRRDRIRTVTRQQKRDLPLLAGPIENLTTSRTLRPRRATLRTHLGLGLILQGVLGALLLGTVAATWLGAFG
jgi:hypothetical protein